MAKLLPTDQRTGEMSICTSRTPASGLQSRVRIGIAQALCVLVLEACGGGGSVGPPPDVSLAVTPTQILGTKNVKLAATTSASNGIDSVKFFRLYPDVALLGSVNTSPYEWQAVAYGGHTTVTTTFGARACDQAGLCTESNIVSVTSSVGPPPEILLAVYPEDVFGGGNVMLTATASASNGIHSVEFFRVSPDGASLGIVDTPPYAQQAVAYGGNRTSTTFSARACDQAGLCTDSNTVSVFSYWICKYPPCQ